MRQPVFSLFTSVISAPRILITAGMLFFSEERGECASEKKTAGRENLALQSRIKKNSAMPHFPPPLLFSLPLRLGKAGKPKKEKRTCVQEKKLLKKSLGEKERGRNSGEESPEKEWNLPKKALGKSLPPGNSVLRRKSTLRSRSFSLFQGGGMGWEEEKASSILPPILRETGRESPVQAKCFLIRELIFFRRARTAASPRGYSFMLMRPPGESLSSMAQSFSRGTFPSRRRNARKS